MTRGPDRGFTPDDVDGVGARMIPDRGTVVIDSSTVRVAGCLAARGNLADNPVPAMQYDTDSQQTRRTRR